MKQRSLIYTLFILMWLIVDFAIQSFFDLRMFSSINYVSHLHFLALLLMTNINNRKEIVYKVLIVCFVLDLFHYNSFPVYYVSYGFAAILVRIWYRHIGSTVIETMVLMALGLFTKEVFLYLSLFIFQGMNLPLMKFLATRSMVIVIGNILLFPIVYASFKFMQRKIDSSISNYF